LIRHIIDKAYLRLAVRRGIIILGGVPRFEIKGDRMALLTDMLKDMGVQEEQIQDLIVKFRENPLTALGAVQELNLETEQLQKLVGVMMSQPEALQEAMDELGISQEELEKARDLGINPLSGNPS
jgi:hypothetical protein